MAIDRDAGLCFVLPVLSLAGEKMENEEIKNTLHSIRNRCLIAEFVIDYGATPFTKEVLPTLLEDNGEDAQRLVVENCITTPETPP